MFEKKVLFRFVESDVSEHCRSTDWLLGIITI